MDPDVYYLDTSILPPFYWPEKLTPAVQTLMNGLETPLISDWTQTEFASALAMRIRMGHEHAAAAQAIIALFQQHLSDGIYERLPVTRGDFEMACDWICRFQTPIRAPDALHLAVSHNNNCVLMTADVRLAESAKILGVRAQLIA